MCSKGRNQVEPAAGAGESGTGWNGRERWPGRYRRSGGMRRSGVGGTARWAGEQMPAERQGEQGRQMPAGSGRMSRRVRYRRNGGWPGGQMPAGRREDQVRSVPGRTAGWAGPGGAGRNGTKSREGRCRLEAAGRAGQVEVTPTGSTSGSRTHESRTHEQGIRTHIKKWGRNNPAPRWCADQALKGSVIALKLRAGVSAQLQLRSNHAPSHTHRHRETQEWLDVTNSFFIDQKYFVNQFKRTTLDMKN